MTVRASIFAALAQPITQLINISMKYIFTLSFSLAALFCSAQSGIKFDKAAHNFGKIAKGVHKSVIFTYTNADARPAVIEFANAECGCTQPEYDQKPILKGQKGSIKVTYTSPAVGAFRKKVNVKFAGQKLPAELTIEGEVITPAGLLASDFNGDVYPEVFDKPTVLKTLGNDPQSRIVNFNALQNLLYKGKVSATNGKFSFSFIVPKDINFQFGQARISYYADNGTYDAQGIDENLVVGGLGNQVANDNAGPAVMGYLNNVQFINGSIVNETPLLLVQLADPSGINLSGNGIGHEITAVIDGNYRETIVLNDYFKAASMAALNGTIQFRLPQLLEGNHKILLKAWDVFNNSSEYMLLCKVIKQDTVKVTRLFNYPNPVYNSTLFSFSLEGPYAGARADLKILTVEGQAVRTLSKAINEAGLRSIEIEWNGRDEKGNRLGRGVYIYQLTIMSKTGKLTRKVQKLIII